MPSTSCLSIPPQDNRKGNNNNGSIGNGNFVTSANKRRKGSGGSDDSYGNNGNNNMMMEDVVPIYGGVPPYHPTLDGSDPLSYRDGDGVVTNFEAWESAWSNAFGTLRVNDSLKHTRGSGGGERMQHDGPISHPLLAVDPGHLPSFVDYDTSTHGMGNAVEGGGGEGDLHRAATRRKQHASTIEILFESLGAPAAFIAPSSMLAAFANGRQTATVVDVGAGGARVTPVMDGIPMETCKRRNGRGGTWLGEIQRRVVEGRRRRRSGRRRVNSTSSNTKDDCDSSKGIINDDDDDDDSADMDTLMTVVHPRYALRRRRNAAPNKSKGMSATGSLVPSYHYPPYRNVRNTVFHRVAVDELMREMLTGEHVVGVTATRDDPNWKVPAFSLFSGAGTCPRMAKQGVNKKVTSADAGADAGAGTIDDNLEGGTFYELPDGTRVDLSPGGGDSDLCRLPEMLFLSQAYSTGVKANANTNIGFDKRMTTSHQGRESLSSPGQQQQQQQQHQHQHQQQQQQHHQQQHDQKNYPQNYRGATIVNAINNLSGTVTNNNNYKNNNDPFKSFLDVPLHELTKASLTAVPDFDVRKELCGSIILVGASSLFADVDRRLSYELSNSISASSGCRCRVVASRNEVERRYASWIGGSILTSLGSFQQLWLSKTEYEEYGPLLSSQKFP